MVGVAGVAERRGEEGGVAESEEGMEGVGVGVGVGVVDGGDSRRSGNPAMTRHSRRLASSAQNDAVGPVFGCSR